jgi:hypothetical protein
MFFSAARTTVARRVVVVYFPRIWAWRNFPELPALAPDALFLSHLLDLRHFGSFPSSGCGE